MSKVPTPTDLKDQEPVLVLSTLVAAALTLIGLHEDVNVVYNVLMAGIPLLGGIIARSKVSPSA